MNSLLILLVALSAVIADPPEEGGGSYHHRPLSHSTTLGAEAGTPDPHVSEEVNRLLEETDYTNEQIHYMPQHISDPDCYVVTYVITEQRHGGRCSRMAGGLPFCGVKNYVYPNHPDCVNSESSGEGRWGSSRWAPFFSRTADIDTPTESTGGNDDDDDDDDDDGTATRSPRFRRDAKK